MSRKEQNQYSVPSAGTRNDGVNGAINDRWMHLILVLILDEAEGVAVLSKNTEKWGIGYESDFCDSIPIGFFLHKYKMCYRTKHVDTSRQMPTNHRPLAQSTIQITYGDPVLRSSLYKARPSVAQRLPGLVVVLPVPVLAPSYREVRNEMMYTE